MRVSRFTMIASAALFVTSGVLCAGKEVRICLKAIFPGPL
jgi:hypothetical protein